MSKGIVWIHTISPILSAAIQLIVGIVPLRNLLVNRSYSELEYFEDQDSFVLQVESLMKKVWSVDKAALCPRKFEEFI